MSSPRIIISMFGGLVRDVYCSIPDAQVVLVDWDQDSNPILAVNETGHRSALVGSFDARPLGDISATDEEAAITEAQEKGLIEEPIFVVS